ncbi:MAG TPA: deoxyribodipyrimidine photo-lyase [Gammaproteobacteria bacterium]|nr:deoxyribodipyrimidine photo-lyase [Gammaproteobacteria bacterium]
MRNLMWFREHDLRLRDNTALYNASLASNDGLIAIFLINPTEWQNHDMAPIRQNFILRQLHALQEELTELNIPLIIHTVLQPKEIPDFLLKLSQKHKINNLYFNDQYELDELRRDQAIKILFEKNHIYIKNYTDQVIFTPGEVLTQQKKYFTVFTPFKNSFLNKLNQTEIIVHPKPKKIAVKLDVPHTPLPSISENKHWPVGEKIAHKKLSDFISHKLENYKINRDFPSLDGTSQLSPYLASGIISIRTCFKKARESSRHETWQSELIWREFYKHIMKNFPRVCMHKPLKLITERIPWENNRDHFEAWKNGRTGIPLIDAAMRQLNQTGWMHNRLRMITAMFLTKNLLIDWRWGEKYFMQHLIDGDLAANNGGWQWAASTGTDAVPYFRIFNPLSQTEKFDPEFIFIKKYCPEALTSNYWAPIVDLSTSRQRAISIYKRVFQHD